MAMSTKKISLPSHILVKYNLVLCESCYCKEKKEERKKEGEVSSNMVRTVDDCERKLIVFNVGSLAQQHEK